jgi:signal transduction histidine kinase
LFLVLALPTAIFTTLTTWLVSNALEEEAVKQNMLTAQLVAKQADEQFFGFRRYVESYATRRRLVAGLVRGEMDVVQEQLADFAEQNRKLSRAILTDANGRLIADFPNTPSLTGRDLSTLDWFRGALQSDHPYVSEVHTRAGPDQVAVVTVAAKIKNADGRLLGFIGGQYAVRDLISWLESIQPTRSDRIAVFDQHEKQVLRIHSPVHADISRHPAVRKVLKQPEGSTHVENLDGFGGSLLSHVPIADLGWTVVAYQDESSVFEPLSRLHRTTFLFFVAALAAIALLGWLWFSVLFAYEEDLRKTVKELENFCYSVAHDLRAPLRAMQGFTTALSDEYADRLDETGKQYAKRVGASAVRMDKLVTDLLNYGRVVHTPLKFENVILDEQARRATEDLQIDIESKRATVAIKKPLGSVHGDPALIESALRHLVDNAIKFTPIDRTPRIEISSERNDGNLRLYVKDNGIGIDPQYREKIFGVFQRLHSNESYSGTGIGLAIVKSAVERMGGKVGVDSKLGKGSSFWIELPTR